MRKWLTVGAVAMLVAWLPFLYAELTSEEAERKDRVLPWEEHPDEAVEARPVDDEAHAAGGEAEEPAEPAAPPAAPAAAPDAPTAPTAPTAEAQPEAPVPARAPGEPGAVAQAPAAAPTAADPAAPTEGEPEVEGEPEGEPDPEEAPEPPKPSGPVAVLRQAFEKQPRDSLWAGDTEHKLRGLFGTADVPAELLAGASCRSSVCRVEMKWTPEHATAYVGVYEASTRLSGAELGVEPIGEADERDQQKVQLYVTRQGYTMANLAR